MITLNEQDAGLVRDGKKWQLRLPIHPQPLHIAAVDLFGNATGESVIWDPAGSSPISPEELTSLCPHAQAGQQFVAQVALCPTRSRKASAFSANPSGSSVLRRSVTVICWQRADGTGRYSLPTGATFMAERAIP